MYDYCYLYCWGFVSVRVKLLFDFTSFIFLVTCLSFYIELLRRVYSIQNYVIKIVRDLLCAYWRTNKYQFHSLV